MLPDTKSLWIQDSWSCPWILRQHRMLPVTKSLWIKHIMIFLNNIINCSLRLAVAQRSINKNQENNIWKDCVSVEFNFYKNYCIYRKRWVAFTNHLSAGLYSIVDCLSDDHPRLLKYQTKMTSQGHPPCVHVCYALRQ